MKKSLMTMALVLAMGSANAAGISDLEPGMTMDQVKEMLGDPSEKNFSEGVVVLTYKEFKMGRGRVPYLLVFDADKKLVEVATDKEGEAANQARIRGAMGYMQRDRAINAFSAKRDDTLTIKVK